MVSLAALRLSDESVLLLFGFFLAKNNKVMKTKTNSSVRIRVNRMRKVGGLWYPSKASNRIKVIIANTRNKSTQNR